jgi:hypothetical protein
MNPTNKSDELDLTLSELFGVGRRAAILRNECVERPIGCGKPATEFRDRVSKREYQISGLCQDCQDDIFGTGC